ncbi:hypothetical protein BHM03_00045321 [Ensete ventricosum]|uniref:Uncharacterized protein n=1 Tax=Ensete ventricosum TaxID=4639 RepID=A0A445MKZ8_ENSVE|nr:hypothetical protein BHM03_00045321 [Ensete ventricosum]
MRVLVLGSSLKVTERVATPIGVIASPVNPVRVEVMGARSRLVIPSLWKASMYNMSAKLPVSIMMHLTQAFAMRAVWVFALGVEGESWITLGSRPLLNFRAGICLPCRGAHASHGWAAHNDVDMSLYRSPRMKGWLVWLPYVLVEVAAMDKVLDLDLQVVAFLCIMPIVAVEATITSAVSVLGSRTQWVVSLQESFFSDLEEDLRSSGVERNIGWPGHCLFASLHPPP